MQAGQELARWENHPRGVAWTTSKKAQDDPRQQLFVQNSFPGFLEGQPLLASFRRAAVPQARRFLDQVLQLVVLALGLPEGLLVGLGCALGGVSVVRCIVAC